MLAIKDVVDSLPAGLKNQVTPELVDRLNAVGSDVAEAEVFRDNFVGFSNIVKEGKFTLENYLNAVRYCTYLFLGKTKTEAYSLTFPLRVQKMRSEGKDISPYVTNFSKGALVTKIIEQSLVPAWIVNRDTHQKAIDTLAALMVGATSEKVRCDAANSILTHLSKPKEAVNNKLSITVNEGDGMKVLQDTLTELAQRQRALVEAGASTAEVVHAPLVVEK